MPADTVPPFIQSVVHPTDLSAASQRAFAHALAVALVRRARLTLLHVDADDDRPDSSEFPAVRTALERWTFARMRREGEPVAEILAAAELVGADLIVMPTAGRAGVFEVLRGSTTEQVLRQAPCPLLAVPASSGT